MLSWGVGGVMLASNAIAALFAMGLALLCVMVVVYGANLIASDDRRRKQ
jgi:hypothetical protein